MWRRGGGLSGLSFTAGSHSTTDGVRVVAHTHAVCHGGSLCSRGLCFAAAGLTQPHTLRSGLPWARGVLGGREGVLRSCVGAAATGPGLFCWSLGLETPGGYWLCWIGCGGEGALRFQKR